MKNKEKKEFIYPLNLSINKRGKNNYKMSFSTYTFEVDIINAFLDKIKFINSYCEFRCTEFDYVKFDQKHQNIFWLKGIDKKTGIGVNLGYFIQGFDPKQLFEAVYEFYITARFGMINKVNFSNIYKKY